MEKGFVYSLLTSHHPLDHSHDWPSLLGSLGFGAQCSCLFRSQGKWVLLSFHFVPISVFQSRLCLIAFTAPSLTFTFSYTTIKLWLGKAQKTKLHSRIWHTSFPCFGAFVYFGKRIEDTWNQNLVWLSFVTLFQRGFLTCLWQSALGFSFQVQDTKRVTHFCWSCIGHSAKISIFFWFW